MNYYSNHTEIGAILDMVERGCARLMKTGGGSLSGGCETLQHHRTSKGERAQIIREYLAAITPELTGEQNSKIMRALADKHGLHYGTIAIFTRDERLARGLNFSRADKYRTRPKVYARRSTL